MLCTVEKVHSSGKKTTVTGTHSVYQVIKLRTIGGHGTSTIPQSAISQKNIVQN